jgi:Uma2 family endonuclease
MSGGKKMVSTKSASLTFEEYLILEDGTDNRYELAHGELLMVPLPTGLHSDIIEFLQDVFKGEIRRRELPWLAKRDVGVRTGINTSRDPDLCVMTSSQWAELRNISAVLQTTPLLAVEVVSPGSQVIDYRYKQSEYAALGISEYWIVDPLSLKVSILIWNEGLYETKEYASDEKIISQLFPDLELTANQVLQAR